MLKVDWKKFKGIFYWGSSDARKIHLVLIGRLLARVRAREGLGIKNLDLLNRALLGKWVWRFTIEESFIWKSCINTKYGA